jgi:hypothetical protein
MAEFESWTGYWDFSQFVKKKARHVMDAKNQRFLDAVEETSKKRKAFIGKGHMYWRAQIGYDNGIGRVLDKERPEIEMFDSEFPFQPERMMPLADRANEGRVNPKGIPCLYLSSDRETAMTEVRPWIGSYVSVAQCVLIKGLKVVSCSTVSVQPNPFELRRDLNPEEREALIWADINRAFSEPVTRNDDVAEYAPTQVLAELFRRAGFDGIVYGSRLGAGTTLAIFDLAAAEVANCHLYKVGGVKLEFSVAARPYYVKKYRGTEGREESDTIPDGQTEEHEEEAEN